MAQRSFQFQVPFHTLLIGLLLTVTPISLVGLFSITQSERSLERTIGRYFKTIANATAAEVSQYIGDRVINVAEISLEPTLVEAAKTANRAYQGLSEEAITARISQIEKSWQTPASESTVAAILGSPGSRLLRRYRTLDQRFLRITVTDERGATIAGTHKSVDYYQGDEQYWQDIMAGGRGAVSVTDIQLDSATNSYYVGIGVPIREEESQRVIGTVDALMDVSAFLTLVNRHQIGPTGRTLLVKGDGSLITGPQVTLSKSLKSEEFDAIRDALGTLSGRQTGFMVANLPQVGRTAIGFADTGLRDSYRNLTWVTIVAQDATEAFAPIRSISRWLGLMCLIGLAMVVILTAYYALHKPVRYAEIGELRPGRKAPAQQNSSETEAPREPTQGEMR